MNAYGLIAIVLWGGVMLGLFVNALILPLITVRLAALQQAGIAPEGAPDRYSGITARLAMQRFIFSRAATGMHDRFTRRVIRTARIACVGSLTCLVALVVEVCVAALASLG